MSILIILIIIILFISLLLPLIKSNLKKNNNNFNFSYSKKTPLSNNEQVLYFRLIEALPDHIILSQVALNMVVKPKANDVKTRNSLFYKIGKKSLDFVILDKSFNLLYVIELDDSSHNREDVKKRDFDKNEILKSAGIQLIRLKTIPSISEINSILK